MIDPTGVFLSSGFSRASASSAAATAAAAAAAAASKLSSAAYGGSFKPLFVHIIHSSNSKDKQTSKNPTDRLFCAVYEPHALDPEADPNDPSDPSKFLANPSAAFFIGGNVRREISPHLLQQQLLQAAIEQQQQQQQQEEEGDEEEDEEEQEMGGSEAAHTPDPISGVYATKNTTQMFASLDPNTLNKFRETHLLQRPLCRFFCSSSSITGGSTAAAAAAAARAQQKDITQTLRALEEFLYLKQQQQQQLSSAAAAAGAASRSRSSSSSSKYIILLLSTLSDNELGSWATASSQTNAKNSAFRIPVLRLEANANLRSLSKTDFAESARLNPKP